MDIPTRIGLGGCGLAAVFGFLPFAVPAMPLTLSIIPIFIGLCVAGWGLWPLLRKAAWKTNVQEHADSSGASGIIRQKPLTYLNNTDSELGPAIERMAHKSAWGRWYAAQNLATSGRRIEEDHLLNTAAQHIVMPKILGGDLEIRGRISGQISYSTIPRTDWRNAALCFCRDPMILWRMRVVPTGVAIITEGDGSTHIMGEHNTVAHLLRFDSLLVDSRQFESLWPLVDSVIDKKRLEFLKEAQKRHFDPDTIKALS